MNSNYPEKIKSQVFYSEDQLINRVISIFILFGLSLLAISWMSFYFIDSESSNYWGNLSNSLAFEILGVLVMYKFVRYLLRTDITDQEKRARLKLGLGALVFILAFWITRGIMNWRISAFVDNVLINLSVEFGGALGLYFLFDQFLELIQKPRQELDYLEKVQRDKDIENLILENAQYRRAVSQLQETAYKFESLSTRINGILSEQKSYSRDEILRLINADTFGKKYTMADVQSVLGEFTDEGLIFSDKSGEYLKKGSAT